MLYKQGDPCTHIYIVIDGEFDVKKLIKCDYKEKQEFNMKEFLP